MSEAPVLLAIDQDPDVLGSVEQPLRDRYARDYHILCISSSSEAMDELNGLAAAGQQVALVLAGQWLEGMTGSELLGEVHRLHPHAKRALLVPWGGLWDRATGEAVFEAIAHGRIDHYVVRPSTPPDELFHQAISGFLLEWAEALRRSPHTIHIVGSRGRGGRRSSGNSWGAVPFRTGSASSTRPRAGRSSRKRKVPRSSRW